MEIPQVLFVFPSEKGGAGRGLRPAGNTKPEEKLEENRGGVKINLRKTSFLKNLRYFYIVFSEHISQVILNGTKILLK